MRSAGRSPGTADPSKKIGVREPASAVTAVRMPAKKNNAFRQDAPDAADPSKSRPRGTSCRKAHGEYHTGEALATPGKKKSNFARSKLSNFAHSKSLTLRVGQHGKKCRLTSSKKMLNYEPSLGKKKFSRNGGL